MSQPSDAWTLSRRVPTKAPSFRPTFPGYSEIAKLWRASSTVWPGQSLRIFYRRSRFFVRGLWLHRDVAPFLQAGERGLGRLIKHRPETIGALEWPYICLSWDSRERLARIRDHYDAVEASLKSLDFAVEEERELLDLDDRVPGLRIVLDQPAWFIREGQLVLNLFSGETRLLSLAFSLRMEPELVAYVGAVQGRRLEGILDVYRELTRSLHGMRPRDFLIEIFCLFCQAAGITRIFAVSDTYRQHRSPYFGSDRVLEQNYDQIWGERGGTPVSPEFYSLPLGGNRREMAEIPSKRRSMYRRRYEMLDHVAFQFAGFFA